MTVGKKDKAMEAEYILQFLRLLWHYRRDSTMVILTKKDRIPKYIVFTLAPYLQRHFAELKFHSKGARSRHCWHEVIKAPQLIPHHILSNITAIQ